jgi:cytochrome c-type biogenesis protein CcmH
MIAFWAMAGVISAVAAILILLRAARAARTVPGAGEAADTTGVFYRRQLAEIGDLADRGLLEEGERKSASPPRPWRSASTSSSARRAWPTSPSRAG